MIKKIKNLLLKDKIYTTMMFINLALAFTGSVINAAVFGLMAGYLIGRADYE